MPLTNRAPVNAAGQIMVTGTTPTPAWPVLGGMTYDPVTGELAVTSAVPNATDPWVGGLRFTNLGALYIVTTIPSPVFYVGGLPVSTLGQLFMSANPPVGSVGGWPIAGDGGVAGIGSGIGPVPIFWAPLLTTLVPTLAGNPAFTFTRATTAYATGVAPGGNAVDGQVLILCDAGEPRFHGARRISANNWSATYADGSAIPAANLLGFIAENAATNLCLQSQTFDVTASWTVNSAPAVLPNTQTAPDGTLTADTFSDGTLNAAHNIFQTLTLTAAVHTFSAYVKQGTLPWVQLNFVGTFWANFNLATGAVGFTSAGVTTAVQTLPNNWFRISVTGTAAAGSNFPTFVALNANINASNPPYVGTGQTMYLWGAQVEASSDPSSYIPTTTAAVVRNQDALLYQVATNINDTVGTAYAEVLSTATSMPADRGIVSNVSATYLLARRLGGNSVAAYDGGNVLVSANAITPGALFKAASRWNVSGSQMGMVVNGGAIANAAFDGSMNLSSLSIGNVNSGATPNGTVRNVKIYSVALTDAELQALTA